MVFWANMRIKLLVISYWLLVIGFTVYSYAFIDPNLTLISWPPFLVFQGKMMRLGYFQRPLSTIIFIFLSFLLFTSYYLLVTSLKKVKTPLKKILFLAVIISGILVFSYPAFSHDIFNYIFNAKMVLHYHANPHKQVALDFASDPWTRFMRNTHTPAPYFYGWTVISLLPAFLGMEKFILNLFWFKVFSLLMLWICFFLLKKIIQFLKLKDKNWRLIIFLLNPLILIEAIGIGHNDLTMMATALASFLLLLKFNKEKKLKFILLSIFCLLFSASTKYATIVILPLFVIRLFKPSFDIGLGGAILLFLLPFSRPLDQLHSWYLTWPLVWTLLAKDKFFINFFYFLSALALFRYMPYIYYGHWNPPVSFLRLIIYLGLPLFLLVYFVFNKKLN